MKRIPRCRLLAVVLAFSMTVPVLADVAETVEKYRTSFEKRMNAELDEHGKAARDLRLNYLEVLNKLKVELGRAENLKGATQVLAEIEMVEDGEEAKDLPADADFRFKRVREKWERGLVEIRSARSKKLKTTVELYLKALDTEKRRLTRAGEIKEALVIEEEEKRVGDLPEVKALVTSAQKKRRPAKRARSCPLRASMRTCSQPPALSLPATAARQEKETCPLDPSKMHAVSWLELRPLTTQQMPQEC